jgi:hypothetical protein
LALYGAGAPEQTNLHQPSCRADCDTISELALDLGLTWNHSTAELWREFEPRALKDYTKYAADPIGSRFCDRIRAPLEKKRERENIAYVGELAELAIQQVSSFVDQ